jgi:hypothetical protein
MALYTSLVWGFDAFARDTNVGAGRIRVGPAWRVFVKILVPLSIILVLLSAIGVVS